MGILDRIRLGSAADRVKRDAGSRRVAPTSPSTANFADNADHSHSDTGIVWPCSFLPAPFSAAHGPEGRYQFGCLHTARRAFTLVEILASLLLMAIIIPVAMQGMSIASRAGIMGQRKASAMRVAERVLNELIVTGQTAQSSNSGTAVDGNASYPWTLESETWSEDPMLQLTVRVTFTVQGNDYTVSATTLIDPMAPPPTSLPEGVL